MQLRTRGACESAVPNRAAHAPNICLHGEVHIGREHTDAMIAAGVRGRGRAEGRGPAPGQSL